MSGCVSNKLDEIDIWGIEWARQRRIMLGIIPGSMIKPQERLGKIRCTLAQIRDEGDGASQNGFKFTDTGHVDQDWPEVYTGFSLLVHRVYWLMPAGHKQVMHLHYVFREAPVGDKTRVLKVSRAQYWIRVGAMKSFLYGGVTVTRGPEVATPRSMGSRRSRRLAVV